MTFTELTANLNVHQSLPDKPALNATELKQAFDEAANLIKLYLNGTLLPELNTAVTNLQNGSSSISGTVNTIQLAVNEATTNITQIQDTISNLKSGATTKISIGSTVPESLENNEVYFQYF